MIDLTGVSHHPAIEELVEILCNKTHNVDRGFFRCEVAYFLGKVASSMRATIVTKDRGDIPVNIYALALATSGYGKGHSIGIMEEEILGGFRKRFVEDTLPVLADQNHWIIANERALRSNTDPQEEYDKVVKEYKRAGAYPFTFDSGSPEGIRQVRTKLLLANCGAISMQIDEIGSNLSKNEDMLAIYLELYDQGRIKTKLTKNTNDNERSEQMEGKTPTNMLLFGTPNKLFDGGVTEDQFYSLLETGYARRCLFGNGTHSRKNGNKESTDVIYDRLASPDNDTKIQQWAAHFHSLADPGCFNWKMIVEREVGIELLNYKFDCEAAAEKMLMHEEVQKAEISHRYFKALKLAGALAFVDQSNEIEMTHLHQAILLTEESGAAFASILTREQPHIKLAKYIAECGLDVTHADLLGKLPFFPKGNSPRNELLSLATQWGYKNNIIIKKTFVDNIEFFRGETLTETNLEDMIFSFSTSWAYDFEPEEQKVSFEELHFLTQGENLHWANHHFKNKHRAEENVIPGFNMLVIDVDGGVSLELVHELMSEIKFMTYTTKRHRIPDPKTGEITDRFRLIIPTNYILKLDKQEYTELVNDVIAWLPFQIGAHIDDSSNQRSKKWLSHDKGEYHYNLTGALFDVLPFIPKTSRNEDHRKEFKAVASLDNLERWFAGKMVKGDRNNQMIKFALALVDSGYDLITVSAMVHAFNRKLAEPMEENRIDTTIMQTVAKRISKAFAA